MSTHPRDWYGQVMGRRATACTVCGWREGMDNGLELHEEHLAHVLAMQVTQTPDTTPPFDPRHLAAVMRVARAAQAPAKGEPVGPLVVWMALDPETERVTVQTREFSDGDFPRGHRGVGWAVRRSVIDGDDYDRLLGDSTPDEQDQLCRQWWSDAAPEGAPPWPE